eukprot:2435563-Pyramimonas_sp.AAC.1
MLGHCPRDPSVRVWVSVDTSTQTMGRVGFVSCVGSGQSEALCRANRDHNADTDALHVCRLEYGRAP